MERSPLTDPRSLGSSLAVHAVIFAIAAVAALGVARPLMTARPPTPEVLRGELEPVDNLAPAEPGGGGSGEAGGLSAFVGSTVAAEAGGVPPDPATDALLAEILPTSPGPAEALPGALPGPPVSGLDDMPGPSASGGGGGGSGGGSGTGVGRGTGPGTEFFGARERGGSFAYVIDCSGSMMARGALDRAKRELMASLGLLSPDASFGVVFYDLRANLFSDPTGRPGLMSATAANKERARTLLGEVVPFGGTDHMNALRTAISIRPEVIFFLSDGDMLSDRDAADLRPEIGRTRIHAIELGLGANLSRVSALRTLAVGSGGTYRYIDTRKFAPPGR